MKKIAFVLVALSFLSQPQLTLASTQKSLARQVCQDLEDYSLQGAPQDYEKRCPGTFQLALVVSKIWSQFNSGSNSCKNLAAQVTQFEVAANKRDLSNDQTEKLKQNINTFSTKLSSEMTNNEREVTAAFKEVYSKNDGFARGGLPCEQDRYGISNLYFSKNLSAQKTILKAAQKIKKSLN